MPGRDKEPQESAMPGITVRGISELVEEVEEGLNSVTDAELAKQKEFQTTLAGHIIGAYQVNKNARRESDIEEEMANSLFQVNMEYRDAELLNIKTGSKIYMGLTATKSRAARSWIKDLAQPANEVPFKITQSEVSELPQAMMELIDKAFEEDSVRLEKEIEDEFAEADKAKEQKKAQGQPPGQAPAPQGQPAQPQAPQGQAQGQPPVEGQPPAEGQPEEAPEEKPKGMLIASAILKRKAELRRDIDEAIRGEIRKIAQADVAKIERDVIDSLQAGGWDQALSDFIEDFTIFPTAFMKGPVVTTKNKLVWAEGIAKPVRQTVFLNSRINPMDVYPSPSASNVQQGNFCEHIRLTKKDLSDLSFLPPETGFKKENIIEVLGERGGEHGIWMDSEVEEEIIEAEKRGSQTYGSEGIYHGCHFWGTASVKTLREFGYPEAELEGMQDHQEVEIEAMMVHNTVIKCLINRDPLGRRPYYSASFQTRAGSIWGKSLPAMMRDIQRMCNACARSLADNMGLSSGPQVAVLVDRLASDGDIGEMEPRKIWQFTSDPQGNAGKPIEFFMVPSNAQELLAVYDKFELKADDVTGVPRYAYGNENSGGAAATASGLSMLLESASKGIKGSIKNISEGLIIPRVEYQFYMELLSKMEAGNPSNFSGDINVKVHAVEALTIKAAEAQLQKELLQVTANPIDQEIMGMEGRGDVLRKVFKGANLPEDAIPSRLSLKEKEKKKEFNQAQMQAQASQQAENQTKTSVEATTIQAQSNENIAAKNSEFKAAELQQKDKHKQTDQQLKGVEIQQQKEKEANRGITKLTESREKNEANSQDLDRKLVVDVSKDKKQEI